MIEIRHREPVVLADDFSRLVAWYRDALGFEVRQLFEDAYHYCLMETPTGIRLGIGSAKEMGIEPADREKNTVVLQFEVDDVKEFFAHLEQEGATITFGPSQDKDDGYWYGGFKDLEGNPVWVVDKDCP